MRILLAIIHTSVCIIFLISAIVILAYTNYNTVGVRYELCYTQSPVFNTQEEGVNESIKLDAKQAFACYTDGTKLQTILFLICDNIYSSIILFAINNEEVCKEIRAYYSTNPVVILCGLPRSLKSEGFQIAHIDQSGEVAI